MFRNLIVTDFFSYFAGSSTSSLVINRNNIYYVFFYLLNCAKIVIFRGSTFETISRKEGKTWDTLFLFKVETVLLV